VAFGGKKVAFDSLFFFFQAGSDKVTS